MWVVSGPFDGEVGIVDFSKPKLLKPGTTYSLGRRNQPLLVNNKKISQHECDFIVGPHTVEDASDPSFRPSLTFIVRKAKHKITICNDDVELTAAEIEDLHDLQDGYKIRMLNGVAVSVHWKPIYAFYPTNRANLALSVSDCASLGIKLTHTMHENVTHYLANHYEASLRMASSVLLLCKIVKPDWLVEVMKLGMLPRNNASPDGTSLEDHFVLPPETKYRPAFSAALIPDYKKFKIWEPNEERVKMFAPFRFVCLQEKATELDGDVKEAVRHGGGSYEAFDIHTGVSKLHLALTRAQAKEGKTTVIVGDAEAMQAAVGEDTWKDYLSKAKSFSLEILSPTIIIQAILEVNVDPLRPKETASVNPSETVSSGSTLSEVVPKTSHSEPSVLPETPAEPVEPAQPVRRKLVRRATSRAVSQEPSNPPPPTNAPIVPDAGTQSAAKTGNDDAQPRPRRILTRRHVPPINPADVGLDGPSVEMEKIPELPARKTSAAPAPTPVVPAPGRPKLKRRFGVDNPPVPLPHERATLTQIPATPEEPALKKFKALFDASNPVDSPPFEYGTQTEPESVPQSMRPRRLESVGASTLSILREEEEETTQTLESNQAKRKLSSMEDDAMDVDEDSSATSNKKRAVENVNAVTRTGEVPKVEKPPTTQGAPVGKPDTDKAFLKAVASTKRGKKTEDIFDREFNNLKISKPDLDRRDPEEEWKVLADFGDDSNLRGNFMVVVEMDVYKKENNIPAIRSTNIEWNGRPNFKKFKKKITGNARPKVELVVSGADLVRRPALIQEPSLSRDDFGSQFDFDTQPTRTRSKKLEEHIFDEDESAMYEPEPTPPIRKARKVPSRAGSAAPSQKSTARGKIRAASALFLDSDDDIQEVSHEQVAAALEPDDDDQTLQSSAESARPPPSRRPTRAPSVLKKRPRAYKDDSDDDLEFSGF
ncbi:hypothetical protein CPC08DRAFT_195855 [Agrocybe pediades]|nr:hypothetical protein CPC08DRAFT_195855 [Agrocybe pediades]